MGFVSRHCKRDIELPKHREKLLKNAVKDLKNNANVLGIYLAGSLAKGNFDIYSDIDLHVIVNPESKQDFINHKCTFPQNWGEVLFFESSSPSSPVVVSHFKCFVKVDSWYHTPNELSPSIWLKNIQALYDPNGIIKQVIQEFKSISYAATKAEVEFWRILLKSWECERDPYLVMKTIEGIVPEFLKLNKSLSLQVNIEDNEENIKQIVEMVC